MNTKLLKIIPFINIVLTTFLIIVFGVSNIAVSIAIILLAIVSLGSSIYRFKVVEPNKDKLRAMWIMMVAVIAIAVVINVIY